MNTIPSLLKVTIQVKRVYLLDFRAKLTLFHYSFKRSDTREECTTRKAEFDSLKLTHVKRKMAEYFDSLSASTRDSVFKCFSLKYEDLLVL